MATIGERIRQERERIKLTQPEFAIKVGVSKGAISQWETDITTPKGKNLMALVAVTGKSAHWFMTGEANITYFLDLGLLYPSAFNIPVPAQIDLNA